MELDLVIDIGNSRIKGGLFEENRLLQTFYFPIPSFSQKEFFNILHRKSIRRALLASVNAKIEMDVKAALSALKIDCLFLKPSELKFILDVDEPLQVGVDRIAGAYGALTRFPMNDAVIIDIGTAITVDLVLKEGRYLGGMIYPGAELCAKALADYTDKLPLVTFKKPISALAKTTETHLQAGIYYGQLGAIERLIAELKLTALSPSSIKIIATGGATLSDGSDSRKKFIEDLRELVDFIDPHLTLVGLREILMELTTKG